MHTDEKRFYGILGVDPAASDQSIRVAFRRRAKQLHPDAPSGDARAFIFLKRAYDVLSNPSQRAAYDKACSPPPPAPPHRFTVPPLPPRPVPRPNPRPTSRRRRGTAWVRYAVAFVIMAAISLGGIQAMISLTQPPPSIRTRTTPRTAEAAVEATAPPEDAAAPGSTKTGFWDPTPAARRN